MIEAFVLLIVLSYALRRISRIPREEFDLPDRLLDIFFASFLLLFTAPLTVPIAALIRLTSSGPSFTRHSRCSERYGAKGKVFRVWKFRTMVKSELEVRPSPIFGYIRLSDSRFTPLGRFLRKTGFDELPQLVNVLRNDMSIFGPAPLTPEQAAQQRLDFPARFRVKPGLLSTWDTLHWQIDVRHRVVRKVIDHNAWLRTEEQYVLNGMPTAGNFGLIAKFVPRFTARFLFRIVEEIRT